MGIVLFVDTKGTFVQKFHSLVGFKSSFSTYRRSMIRQLWIRKAVSACVLFAVFMATSMVTLAGPGRIAAELTVSGKAFDGEAPMVMVNGEASKSGRSVFSSSTVSTPEDAVAQLGIGKAGRIELDSNSSVNLIFDDSSIEAELTSGRLTVLGSLGTVKVRTTDGKSTTLNAGESINASGEAQGGRQGRSKDKLWIWLLVAAGAAVAIAVAVSQSGNNSNPVVSPNR